MAENSTSENPTNSVKTITTDFSSKDSPFNDGGFSGVDPYFQAAPASAVVVAEEQGETADKDEAPKAEAPKAAAPKKAAAPSAPADPSK